MINSVADVSAFPPHTQIANGPTVDSQIQAVNRTSIKIHGQRLPKLSLGLHRSFSHIFIVADIPHPILGAYFLERFNLSWRARQCRVCVVTPQIRKGSRTQRQIQGTKHLFIIRPGELATTSSYRDNARDDVILESIDLYHVV